MDKQDLVFRGSDIMAFEIRLKSPCMINGLLITSDSEKWIKNFKVDVSDTRKRTKNIFHHFSKHSKNLEMFPGRKANKPKTPYTRRLYFPNPEITDR